jgi:hypothetical protein
MAYFCVTNHCMELPCACPFTHLFFVDEPVLNGRRGRRCTLEKSLTRWMACLPARHSAATAVTSPSFPYDGGAMANIASLGSTMANFASAGSTKSTFASTAPPVAPSLVVPRPSPAPCPSTPWTARAEPRPTSPSRVHQQPCPTILFPPARSASTLLSCSWPLAGLLPLACWVPLNYKCASIGFSGAAHKQPNPQLQHHQT